MLSLEQGKIWFASTIPFEIQNSLVLGTFFWPESLKELSPMGGRDISQCPKETNLLQLFSQVAQQQLLPKPAFHSNTTLLATWLLRTQDLHIWHLPLVQKRQGEKFYNSHSHSVIRKQVSKIRTPGFEILFCHLSNCVTFASCLTSLFVSLCMKWSKNNIYIAELLYD